MIYNSAGHHNKDSGAVAQYEGKQIQENLIMMEFRDLISNRIKERGYKYIQDSDNETLPQYLARIKPGSGSVLCESHLNGAASSKATGIEVIIPDGFDKYDKALAIMIATGLHRITGLALRNGGTGVITEADSHRGKLGFLRKPGTNVLIEYGFITNSSDMKILFEKKKEICDFVADCLIIAEDWLS